MKILEYQSGENIGSTKIIFLELLQFPNDQRASTILICKDEMGDLKHYCDNLSD